MPQYIDSYYLVDSRESNIIYNFIEKFCKKIVETTDDYPLPQFAETHEMVYHSVKELISYLESNPTIDYVIYWRNEDKKSQVEQFTLQYTNDGKMILGVSIAGREPSSKKSVQLFKNIKNYLNSQEACICVEEPPPINSIEFIDFCNERYMPRR